MILALDPPPGGGYPNEITALGKDALFNESPSLGLGNTAIGFEALYNNTSASANTAVGDSAMHDNTTGLGNTAVGYLSMEANTNGGANTALGEMTLMSNTTGVDNTALGDEALRYNTTGSGNTAVGATALTVGNGTSNTAVGYGALTFTTSGSNNTAVGNNALALNTTGTANVGIGNVALNDLTTGSNNTALGSYAGQKLRTGSYNIDIGNQGTASDNRTIRIGAPNSQRNTFIAGINGVTVAGGVGVVIDNQGHLGTVTSSARYKEAIKPMDKSSETILALKPVSFHYKKELDPQSIPQFGLVAEDVAKVDPDLVAKDEEGKPYTVRYEAVNAMLLNEFLKEHRKVEEQSSKIAEQDSKIADLESKLDRLEKTFRSEH